MNEFDNEELVVAFENIMSIFSESIAPFAVEICEHLKAKYIRLVKQDQEEDDLEGESIMAALASLSSIWRLPSRSVRKTVAKSCSCKSALASIYIQIELTSKLYITKLKTKEVVLQSGQSNAQ